MVARDGAGVGAVEVESKLFGRREDILSLIVVLAEGS